MAVTKTGNEKTMIIIPAIDLKDGQCVRLKQGRMDDSTVFGDDPVAMAGRWRAAGCRRLHLVDLNGAVAGKPIHAQVVKDIRAAYPDLPLQIGGGIRDIETIAAYVEAGVQYCIIGTQAVKTPEFVDEACRLFPGHIMVGLDARDGWVATEGWDDVSTVQATDLAIRFATAGVSAIIYTDIARDGMMQGVNIEATVRVAQAGGIPVIASGGVSSIDDVRQLLAVADQGIMGAITGRAIYEGALDLAEAQALCDGGSV